MKLTTVQVADLLGVSTNTIANWVRNGVLKADKSNPRQSFFSEADVSALYGAPLPKSAPKYAWKHGHCRLCGSRIWHESSRPSGIDWENFYKATNSKNSPEETRRKTVVYMFRDMYSKDGRYCADCAHRPETKEQADE